MQASQLAPDDKGAARELQLARKALKQEDRAAAKVYKSAFKALAASGETLAGAGAQKEGQQEGQQREAGGSAAAAEGGGALLGLLGWLAQLVRALQRGLLGLLGRRQQAVGA